jgi:surface protein
MKNLIITVLLGVFLLSCGKTVNSDVKFKRASLTGFVQKGPFINGTRVNLQELNQSFRQTGNVFSTEMTSNAGRFEIRNIELESSYTLLSASGFYFNEVKGKISEAPLTLNGLVDLSSTNSVNLNILTHLMRPRIEYLLSDGKTFLNATQQARNELLGVFGFSLSSDETAESFDISQNVESAAILLAVSVIMQGSSGTGELSELLATFSDNFRTLGVITNPQILTKLRLNAINLDYDTIQENLINRYQNLGESASIPDFREKVSIFLQKTGEAPIVEDVAVVNISSQGGRITAMVNPNSLMTDVLLLYGTDEVLTDSLVVTNEPISGEGFQKVEASLVDLVKNTSYNFQILARNVEGETLSDVFSLKTLDNFDLNIEVQGEGEVNIAVIQAKTTPHDEGTNLELRALPAENWVFVNWGGDLSGNENPKVIVVDTDKQVTATFQLKTYPLNVSVVGGGTVGIEPQLDVYPHGTEVTLTPTPSEGWEFESWGGNVSGTTVPLVFTVTSERSVTATFKRKDYPLTISIVGEGTVEEQIIPQRTTQYPFETMVQLTSKPTDGWVFYRWGGDLNSNQNPATIQVNEPKTVISEFKSIDELLTIEIIGEGSVEIQQSPIENNPSGRIVTLIPNPSNGWSFLDWGGDLSGSQVPIQVILEESTFIRITFTPTVYLSDNGITIMCPNGRVGDIGLLDGVEYEVVDRNLLEKRRNEGKDLSKVCVSSVTNMSGMFSNSEFNQPIGNWDVSSVTDMSAMFNESYFNQPIGNWDVSSVTGMEGMFNNSQFNQPIGNWDVSSVTNMSGMFSNSEFNQPIGNWDVSSVTDMVSMFGRSQFNQPIGNWDVSSVTDMSGMFNESYFNQPIGNWDVSSVTNMVGMFWGTPFNQPIGNWDVSSVTVMAEMFWGTPFNQPIGDWDVSKVTNMFFMFWGTPFNQPIGNWDVSSVTDMGEMFKDSKFNQPIGNWDVSSVRNMSQMFNYSSQFNQDLSQWCVSRFQRKPDDFDSGTPQWVLPKPVWGTCPTR